jgi:hypothetical protein
MRFQPITIGYFAVSPRRRLYDSEEWWRGLSSALTEDMTQARTKVHATVKTDSAIS